MIINNNEFYIEIIPDSGKELYNEELDISTNKVTFPLGSDISKWIERDIIIEENDNTTI